MNKKFIYFFLALILVGCDGSGAGEDDGGVQDGTVQDGNKADAGDGDTDADTDTDTDSDGDSDAGEDACIYDPEDRVGWVRTWGGEGSVDGRDVAAGPDNTVVVVGIFSGTADLDPTSGVDEHTPEYKRDAYVSKFTDEGDYLWTRVIESDFLVEAESVKVMEDGSIIVGGEFSGTTDFNPGPRVEERVALGNCDSYILKLTPEGEYMWLYTVIGEGYINFYDLAISTDEKINFTGPFTDTIIFESDSGQEMHSCLGDYDVYTAQIDSEGNYVWSGSVGSIWLEEAGAVAIGPDGSVAVIGRFGGMMDFDPGPGVDEHDSTLSDVFLINLDSDGNYKWGRHIQCPGIEFGQAVAVDDEGGIYIGVEHSNPVDFDPEDGVGEVECTDVDCFSITKYSKDGEYLWTRTVTSNHTLHIEDLVSTQEAILGTGTLIGLADFDPGPDVDMHGRNSGADIYITKLGLDGSYEWTTSIGRPGDIYRPSISINLDDYIYITAYFSNTVDFDPSECRDERTAGVDDPNMNAFLWKVSWDGKYYP